MTASVSSGRAGVWPTGARGSVATTVVAGRAAAIAGLNPPTGLVTESPEAAVGPGRTTGRTTEPGEPR